MDPSSRCPSPFAVGTHERGVAIVRRTPDGLACEASADGVTWVSEASSFPEADGLRPLCTAEYDADASLLCADEAGAVVPVRLSDGRATTGEAFRPVPDGEDWYESPPEPEDLALVRDESAGVFRAFFCARRRVGRDPERRGCIGAATSPDCRRWTLEPPIFAPNRFPRLFTPHVVSHAGRTVLFYTTPEHGDLRGIRFALAPHLEGPYERTESDVLACDVRPTVHTAPLADQRLVFFSRKEPGSRGPITLSRPGRLDFHADGRPFVRFHDKLLSLADRNVFHTEASLASDEPLVRVLPRYGADFHLSARISGLGARAAGLLFRTSITGHDNIVLWLEFDTGALTLRRGVKGRLLGRVRRPLSTGTPHRIGIWAEGAFADVYLDDEWVLSGYTETRKSGGFGLAVAGGPARFDAVSAQAIRPAS